MKKIISIVMAVIIGMSFIACGDKKNKDKGKEGDGIKKQEEPKSGKAKGEGEYPEEMRYTNEDMHIRYNYFKDMTNYDNLGSAFYVCIDGDIILTNPKFGDHTPEMPLSEMPDFIQEGFNRFNEYSFKDGHPQSVKIDKSKETLINGIKTMEFDGHIVLINPISKKVTAEYPILGYYFWKNGGVYQLIGTDIQNPILKEGQKEKLKKRVDAMMHSVRDCVD